MLCPSGEQVHRFPPLPTKEEMRTLSATVISDMFLKHASNELEVCGQCGVLEVQGEVIAGLAH